MDDGALKILIIDDDEDDVILVRDKVKDIRGKEYQVDKVYTYHEAQKLLERNKWVGIL